MNSKDPAEDALPDGEEQAEGGKQQPDSGTRGDGDLTGPDFEPPAQPSESAAEPENSEPTLVLPDDPEVPETVVPEPVAPQTAAAGTMFPPVESPSDPGRAGRSKSRVVKIVLISVAAVLLLFVVGDRIANSAAERTLARTLQTEMSTSEKPTVDIGGFPFATQFLTGSFSEVHFVADDATVPLDGQSVKLKHVDVTVHDVKASNRYSQIVAGSGEATAVVDWSSASALAGQQLSYADPSKIKLDFSFPLGQLSLQGSISGRPELDVAAQTVAVVEPEVSVASVDVPQSIVDTVANAVLRPIPIPELPYNIEITQLSSQTDGLLLAGTASNIPIVGQ